MWSVVVGSTGLVVALLTKIITSMIKKDENKDKT